MRELNVQDLELIGGGVCHDVVSYKTWFDFDYFL